MKIYLASAYGRREEMLGYAAELTARGHEITARWIQGLHETPPDGIAVESTEHHAWCAIDDIDDIVSAAAVVSFTGGDTRKRGGRQVEFGIGVALEKTMVLIGERENVFHHLPSVVHHDSWDAFLASALPFGDGVCNVCGCHDLDCSDCFERTGTPCHWVEPGLCSACAPVAAR